MTKVTIIIPQQSTKEFKNLLENSRKGPYPIGININEDSEIKGMYKIIYHDGLQDLEGFQLRILKDKKIIVQPKWQSAIEQLLRQNKIPFRGYEDMVLEKHLIQSQTFNKLNIPINVKPDLIYQPQQR